MAVFPASCAPGKNACSSAPRTLSVLTFKLLWRLLGKGWQWGSFLLGTLTHCYLGSVNKCPCLCFMAPRRDSNESYPTAQKGEKGREAGLGCDTEQPGKDNSLQGLKPLFFFCFPFLTKQKGGEGGRGGEIYHKERKHLEPKARTWLGL